MHNQHAKKVVSDSPGLVDFTIGLVNSVLNLPYRQVKFFVEFQKKKRTVKSILLIKNIFGASWKDVWASKQCNNDFLCTLTTKAKRNMYH